MNFGVTFTTGNQSKNLLDKIGSAGIDFLDTFREDYPEYNNLSYKDIKFYDYCPINGSSVDVSISEELARESGLFKGKEKIKVIVHDFFSRYVELVVEESYGTDYHKKYFLGFPVKMIGEKYLSSVNVKYGFDFDQMLSDWRDDGFPTSWDHLKQPQPEDYFDKEAKMGL